MTDDKLYKALFRNMINGVAHCQAVYDNAGKLTDWMYMTVNPAFEIQTGIREIKGKLVSEVIPNLRETSPELFDIYERVSRGGKPERFEQYVQALKTWFDVSVYSTEPGTFTAIFENITEQKKILFDVESANLGMKIAYDQTILGWSKVIELHNKELSGHHQRVHDKTLKFLFALNYYSDDIQKIRYGALLHDVGKIGIPDQILMKTGPLTEDEWRIMKLHPFYAYEFLNSIEYLRGAINIPYCHHEHWDGKGYPRGLEGTEIPFEARAFAVIDVWDALTSDRPYRIALPRQTALEYIERERGVYFDPDIVDKFIEMESESEL